MGHANAQRVFPFAKQQVVGNTPLGPHIQCGQRVIQNHHIGRVQHCACQRHALFLPTREVEPALANLGVQCCWPLVDLVRQACQLQGTLDMGVAQVFALAIQRQVVAQRAAGNKSFLRAVGKPGAAGPTHGARAGRVFRQQQAQQHGLAGTHGANDGQALAGLQIQRNIAQYGLIFCGAETQVVDVQAHRTGLGRRGGFSIFQI